MRGELDHPGRAEAVLARGELAAVRIEAHQHLGPRTLRCSAEHHERVQGINIVPCDHRLCRRAELQQREIFFDRFQIVCRSKRQSPHRALTDEGQPVERRQASRITATLQDELVHQQQAPAVGQRIRQQPGQVEL
ncbi:hypothetical protein [Rhizobacter sp. P5_C2]